MSPTIFTMEDILAILPHRAPFLFVSRVVKLTPDKEIVTELDITSDQPWFIGHFPQKAIMPGVLITDGCAQTCGLLWGLSKKVSGGSPVKEPQIFMLASVNMKYLQPTCPGDTITTRAFDQKGFGQLFSYSVEVTCNRRDVARGTLTLAMMDKKS